MLYNLYSLAISAVIRSDRSWFATDFIGIHLKFNYILIGWGLRGIDSVLQLKVVDAE